MVPDTPNRFPTDFPGFLRSAEGGYIKHEDFLTFVAGASTSKTGDVKDRAMAWLRRQGVTGPIDQLSPADVSRLTGLAQKTILARTGKERRVASQVDVTPPSPADWGSEPPPET